MYYLPDFWKAFQRAVVASFPLIRIASDKGRVDAVMMALNDQHCFPGFSSLALQFFPQLLQYLARHANGHASTLVVPGFLTFPVSPCCGHSGAQDASSRAAA
ncbi:MAG: hypothetical protein ONB48_10915 [candidate division KSB1 bacterium]|nr:hypothetical protein [candidate division KSB1 bacterium]MDZ7275534.1 hypothetical protein [candidate division KSB1 bacterium]MDZ7286154.1 hypothetical protein [candidate division KSB1 bacterium]MDZ7296380.1 hypothetical protein [candidate division KSB1 bacterium]MDZ7306214.1 hypothetical protein [candidate division KSB1 bacterium]